MQEFLTNNTVNCNLMSLTGYRTLIILGALIESPKTNDEINDCLLNNQYIQEKFSNDTLRIYINSLREIGCEIVPANKSIDKKYKLLSHPFAYDISKSELNALSKLYKKLHNKVEISEILAIENFFTKLMLIIENESTKEFLRTISFLKNIDKSILQDLIFHCKNKNQIVFVYNSPKSGPKKIEIIAEKISFKSEKLYLWGNNLTHKEYSYFAVERIQNISNIQILKNHEVFSTMKVVYEMYNQNEDFLVESDEKIVEKTKDKLIIEVNSKNEFSLIQRLLYKGSDCKVIEPNDFKLKIIEKLKTMEAIYEKI